MCFEVTISECVPVQLIMNTTSLDTQIKTTTKTSLQLLFNFIIVNIAREGA